MKKLISLLIALVLCLSLAASAESVDSKGTPSLVAGSMAANVVTAVNNGSDAITALQMAGLGKAAADTMSILQVAEGAAASITVADAGTISSNQVSSTTLNGVPAVALNYPSAIASNYDKPIAVTIVINGQVYTVQGMMVNGILMVTDPDAMNALLAAQAYGTPIQIVTCIAE